MGGEVTGQVVQGFMGHGEGCGELGFYLGGGGSPENAVGSPLTYEKCPGHHVEHEAGRGGRGLGETREEAGASGPVSGHEAWMGRGWQRVGWEVSRGLQKRSGVF